MKGHSQKFYFRKTLLPKNRRMKRHNTCNGDVRTDIPVFRTAYKQKRAGDRPENKNGNLARFPFLFSGLSPALFCL